MMLVERMVHVHSCLFVLQLKMHIRISVFLSGMSLADFSGGMKSVILVI